VSLLEARGLSKEFRSAGRALHVLKEVDVVVEEGETLAITGPSGSGKSTLLALLAGLERPTRGRVLWRGKPLASDEDALALWRRENVGFIFQNFRLVPALTAQENVALALELAGRTAAKAAAKAAELLDALGLGKRLDHFPHQLSGGEQQRAAIARAYAHEPALILADEPTGSLDRETAGAVLDALLSFNAGRRAALVVVTHDPHVSAKMGRTVSLDGGRLG
jgi:putative ABC transport system ATP-binding protein